MSNRRKLIRDYASSRGCLGFVAGRHFWRIVDRRFVQRIARRRVAWFVAAPWLAILAMTYIAPHIYVFEKYERWVADAARPGERINPDVAVYSRGLLKDDALDPRPPSRMHVIWPHGDPPTRAVCARRLSLALRWGNSQLQSDDARWLEPFFIVTALMLPAAIIVMAIGAGIAAVATSTVVAHRARNATAVRRCVVARFGLACCIFAGTQAAALLSEILVAGSLLLVAAAGAFIGSFVVVALMFNARIEAA